MIIAQKIPNLYKHLYLVDCQFLVGTIQNLLCSMEDAFIRYYIMLTNLEAAEKYIKKLKLKLILILILFASCQKYQGVHLLY